VKTTKMTQRHKWDMREDKEALPAERPQSQNDVDGYDHWSLWTHTAYVTLHARSTAQGGGGSFKDRKPIGEVCFLWRMDFRANPLMDRKVVGVFFW
jgi:hypothetical protein